MPLGHLMGPVNSAPNFLLVFLSSQELVPRQEAGIKIAQFPLCSTSVAGFSAPGAAVVKADGQLGLFIATLIITSENVH